VRCAGRLKNFKLWTKAVASVAVGYLTDRVCEETAGHKTRLNFVPGENN
jgi:hypothetical protein